MAWFPDTTEEDRTADAPAEPRVRCKVIGKDIPRQCLRDAVKDGMCLQHRRMAESAVEAPVVIVGVPPTPEEPPAPPLIVKLPEPSFSDDDAELRYLAQKYGFVLNHGVNRHSLLTFLREQEEDRRLVIEFAWKLREQVIVEQEFGDGFFICGDGKWDRPDPTIGQIDMIKSGYIRLAFDATPNYVFAWIKPADFRHLKRFQQPQS